MFNVNKTRCRNYGVAIVAVLWVVAILAAIVAVTARTSRIDTRVTRTGGEYIKMKWAARSGLETAIMILAEDDNDSDSFIDDWNLDDENGGTFEIGGCDVEMQLIDQASKLNINVATKGQFLQLPEMTDETADSILDWKDKDDKIRPGGAEDGYYQNLAPAYHNANNNFNSVREMGAVKDVTEDLLLGGEEENQIAWADYLTSWSAVGELNDSGKKKLNINSAGESQLVSSLGLSKSHAKWIIENKNKQQQKQYTSITNLINEKSPKKKSNKAAKSKKAEPLDIQTFCDIADQITVSKEDFSIGKVNINTAGSQVLAMVFDGDEELADKIINSRQEQTSVFSSVCDLLEQNLVDVKTYKKVADRLTVKSDVFMFNCTVTSKATNAKLNLTAVISRLHKPAQIIYYYMN